MLINYIPFLTEKYDLYFPFTQDRKKLCNLYFGQFKLVHLTFLHLVLYIILKEYNLDTGHSLDILLDSDRTSKSYTHAKSAYIQGTWNFSHWIDDEGEVLQYTKWHSGMTFIPSKSHSIKIKQYNSGYYWQEATSGDLYVRNFFCGYFLL